MSLLEQLPAELLLHCCSFLDTPALLSLSLVSHSIQPYAEQNLYHEFQPRKRLGIQAVWEFLRTILQRPELVRCVRRVILPQTVFENYWANEAIVDADIGIVIRVTSRQTPQTFFVRTDTLEWELFLQAVERLGFTRKPEWYETILKGRPIVWIYALVYSLPNLTVFRTCLPDAPRFCWRFRTEDQIPRFKRLREFSVMAGSSTPGELSFEECKQLLGLPSLKALGAVLGCGPFTRCNPLEPPDYFGKIEEGSSLVKHLYLENIDHLQVMKTLVAAPRALESFRYRYPSHIGEVDAPFFPAQMRIFPQGYGFCPRVLGECLERHADTLEYLHLTIDRRIPTYRQLPVNARLDIKNDKRNSVAWIRLSTRGNSGVEFRKLRFLAIDLRFLLGAEWYRAFNNAPAAMEELSLSLPPNLEQLELHATFVEPNLKDLLDAVSTEFPWSHGMFSGLQRFAMIVRMMNYGRDLIQRTFDDCAKHLDPIHLMNSFYTELFYVHVGVPSGWRPLRHFHQKGRSRGQRLRDSIIRTTFHLPDHYVDPQLLRQKIAGDLCFRFSLYRDVQSYFPVGCNQVPSDF